MVIRPSIELEEFMEYRICISPKLGRRCRYSDPRDPGNTTEISMCGDGTLKRLLIAPRLHDFGWRRRSKLNKARPFRLIFNVINRGKSVVGQA